MTSAVLYGTTSDNELRPVRVTDSGEFVTDGGGGSDWYANLYIGGNPGDPTISLLNNGNIQTDGYCVPSAGLYTGATFTNGIGAVLTAAGSFTLLNAADDVSDFINCWHGTTDPEHRVFHVTFDGNVTAAGVVYAKQFIPEDGYDVSKIGQALSTIHDVIESVDDLEGLKNLFHLLLDNLKSDPTPPEPPE